MSIESETTLSPLPDGLVPLRPRAPFAMLVLTVLAVGYTLWAAQDLLLPVLLAMFFALVGNPILRLLQRLRVPRFLGAVLVLAAAVFAVRLTRGTAAGRPERIASISAMVASILLRS